jgi:hypothetical protein
MFGLRDTLIQILCSHHPIEEFRAEATEESAHRMTVMIWATGCTEISPISRDIPDMNVLYDTTLQNVSIVQRFASPVNARRIQGHT